MSNQIDTFQTLPGPQGPPGQQGPTGADGPDGPAGAFLIPLMVLFLVIVSQHKGTIVAPERHNLSWFHHFCPIWKCCSCCYLFAFLCTLAGINFPCEISIQTVLWVVQRLASRHCPGICVRAMWSLKTSIVRMQDLLATGGFQDHQACQQWGRQAHQDLQDRRRIARTVRLLDGCLAIMKGWRGG